MNIDWVIPCRYAEIHDNLATIVGGGIDTYWLPELPAPIQVVIAVRVLALAEEFDGREHAVANRVRDPHGELISEVIGQLAIAGEAARPEWLTGITLASVVQFDVTEEGTYTLEHVIDDVTAALPIHVVHGLPPGAEVPPD